MKTVLITGGTGFLGRHLAKALKKDYRVVVTGRNNKQNFQANKISGCDVYPMDVARIESVRDTFLEVKPDIVIHAAATKFVDLSEKQPMECIDVNVLGSQNVARVALEMKVDAVIGVSTDKAAPPIRNTYGLSKATMERVFCSLDNKSETRFMCVRYGNVAWSTGSVLPIWKQMHKETGVLRSTGPDMTRFFFTVDEAVNLVVTAVKNVDSLRGKILSREMKSSLIRDILDVWVEEFGGSWDTMEGRPGDREYEHLIGDQELEYTTKVDFDGIEHYVISFNERAESPVKEVISSHSAQRLNKDEIRKLITEAPQEGL